MKEKRMKEAAQPSIEDLQARFLDLQKKQIEANQDLKNAKKTLEELQREAREKYDTEDVAALEEKLREMKAENERRRAEYQAALDRIETELEDVERRFSADAPDDGLGPA